MVDRLAFSFCMQKDMVSYQLLHLIYKRKELCDNNNVQGRCCESPELRLGAMSGALQSLRYSRTGGLEVLDQLKASSVHEC